MTFNRFTALLVSLQHNLFYILLAFGRFNLYVNAYGFLARKAFDHRRARGGRWSWWLEVIGVGFFWCWFGAVLKGCGSWSAALTYLVVSHVVTSPLHVQVGHSTNCGLTPDACSCIVDRFVAFFHVHRRSRSDRVIPSPST